MRPVPVLVALVLLLGLMPLGAASWRGPGSQEPDTADDRADLMFSDPDQTASEQKVYFNGFMAFSETSLNPNVATTGSRLLPLGSVHHRAMLGVWKDCNRDGYIGLAESALQDYRVELLLDDSLCPPIPGGIRVHNDAQWVNEFLSIGMVDPCEFAAESYRLASCPNVPAFALNERVHYVNETFVWADVGAPGSVPARECATAPMPRGSTASTGALLGHVDCQSSRGIVAAINALDEDGSLGLRFEDPERPQDSSSHLDQDVPVSLYGNEGSPGLLQQDGAPSAEVWDCTQPQANTVHQPAGPSRVEIADPSGTRLSAGTFPWVIVYSETGVGFRDHDGDPATPGVLEVQVSDDEGRLLWAPAPAPAVHDPEGSAWSTLARAADGPRGDCDPATRGPVDGLYAGDAIEDDSAPILDARKARTSFAFTFFDGHRGVNPATDAVTGATTPSDGGIFLLDHDRGGDGPLWSATAGAQQDPQLVSRDDLAPTGPRFFTYYAQLGPAAAAFRAPGGVGTYGAENCGDETAGIHRGWNCDASAWWRDEFGADNRPRYAEGMPYGRVPGDVYQLRDVDCYDGEIVRGSNAWASLVLLTDEGGC